MAFRQPTRHVPHRIYVAPEEARPELRPPQPVQQSNESEEWILFSPVAASTTDRTQASSIQRTRRTVSHSYLSGVSSIDTAVRSDAFDDEGSEAVVDEDDAELDSLDSHLHEFGADAAISRDSPLGSLNESSHAVLPTHDGLGSFRVNNTVMGEGIQEHLYAFEKYNPRRTKRRRESLELAQLEIESDRTIEEERTRRIEEWRLEQSRALLEEIQQESRRRKRSIASERPSLLHDNDEADSVTFAGGPQTLRHDQSQDGENEGILSRITRRVIQDLMGIDDSLLSILFGKASPEDVNLSSTPPATRSAADSVGQETWEYRLLDRVSRELGILINQLSDHPGAFSTYTQVCQMPLPYAGLPIIPEASLSSSPAHRPSTVSTSTPHFQPTLPASQPVNISRSANIDSRSDDDVDMDATPRPSFPIHSAMADESATDFSKEDWERQLDIKMVFRYLRSRFTSRPPSPEPLLRYNGCATVKSPQDSAAQVARVRQHHPLVKGQAPTERRTFKISGPTGLPILHRKHSSSCASQSTRKSAKRNSGSSRHYWDINGSIGSGSLIASTGAMGSWGEV